MLEERNHYFAGECLLRKLINVYISGRYYAQKSFPKAAIGMFTEQISCFRKVDDFFSRNSTVSALLLKRAEK